MRALTNALNHDRLHHAYLFTGTRGVGKTTLARIFAKALNCEEGVRSVPCGQCSACSEIDEGRFVDLLEVDAASRTKVDQTRELLDNVPYAPVRGRYKVYLIDEVHMFSDSSFNALLKTLEEPPPHVKFLLATTDPRKVPVTVLSRCLQFNLKRLPLEKIRDHLGWVLDREAIEYERPGLLHLARAADGSIRDALSLMDQAISFGGGQVMEADVRTMLGTITGEQVHTLLEVLADRDAQAVMEQVAVLAERAPDFSAVLQELLSLLHRTALCQVVPDALDESTGDAEQVRSFGKRITPEDLQLYYQIGLIGQRDLPLAPDPRSGLEMVLLRMLAFRPAGEGGAEHRSAPKKAPASRQVKPKGSTPPPPARVRGSVEAGGKASNPADWHWIVSELDLGGISRQLASNCVYESWDGALLVLRLDPAHRHLKVGSSEQRLRKALEEYLECEVRLQIQVEQPASETPSQRQARGRADQERKAEANVAADPVVRAMEERLGATVIPGSVKPGNNNDAQDY